MLLLHLTHISQVNGVPSARVLVEFLDYANEQQHYGSPDDDANHDVERKVKAPVVFELAVGSEVAGVVQAAV